MDWLEISVAAHGDPDAMCERLAALGAESFVIEDENDFKAFLENNTQYWDFVDDALERSFEGASRVKFWVSDDDAGRAVLPAMGPRSFRIDPQIEAAMKAARVWSKFMAFPPLYRRVRAYNVAFYKRNSPARYRQGLARLIKETKRGRMFGEWNDFGRLPDD